MHRKQAATYRRSRWICALATRQFNDEREFFVDRGTFVARAIAGKGKKTPRDRVLARDENKLGRVLLARALFLEARACQLAVSICRDAAASGTGNTIKIMSR